MEIHADGMPIIRYGVGEAITGVVGEYLFFQGYRHLQEVAARTRNN